MQVLIGKLIIKLYRGRSPFARGQDQWVCLILVDWWRLDPDLSCWTSSGVSRIMVKSLSVTADSFDMIRGNRRGAVGIQFILPLVPGATLNPINSTTISTVVVPIANHYHASVAESAWFVAALYFSSAVGQPVMGRLADQFGARRTYLMSLCVIVVAGAIGTIADSVLALIFTRMLLGVGTSCAYPPAIKIFCIRAEKPGAKPCRPSTLSQSFDLDYRILVAGGCCADPYREAHDMHLSRVFPRQATVTSAALLCDAIRPPDLAHPKRLGPSTP